MVKRDPAIFPVGFRRKELRGQLAIGITANFINRHTSAEAQVPEISGVARIYNQRFFQELHTEMGEHRQLNSYVVTHSTHINTHNVTLCSFSHPTQFVSMLQVLILRT